MFGFLFKIIFLVSLAILIRGTLPRYRIDQLLALNWKILIFIYFFFLVMLLFNIYYLYANIAQW